LVTTARNELIASFDDDSYPSDVDFFERARMVAASFPKVALFAANIYHRGDAPPADTKAIALTPSFGAGAVLFRRSKFIAAGGFVPLVVAYGMEEEDLALRLFDGGETLLRCPWLRVYHDTDLSHHCAAPITAAAIANIALLAWLRYPPTYWPYGVLQVANRVVWSLRVGRRAGVFSGLASIVGHLTKHRHLRRPVSAEAILRRRRSRSATLSPLSLA
jgi:hypothetical protein